MGSEEFKHVSDQVVAIGTCEKGIIPQPITA